MTGRTPCRHRGRTSDVSRLDDLLNEEFKSQDVRYLHRFKLTLLVYNVPTLKLWASGFQTVRYLCK